MKVTLNNPSIGTVENVATRCPHCGHFGTFLTLGISDIYEHIQCSNGVVKKILGIRKCPNQKCNGHLFFISDGNKNILLTSPSEIIPFDKENIPKKVLNTFEEAIKCHSNSCFIASAIMIRCI